MKTLSSSDSDPSYYSPGEQDSPTIPEGAKLVAMGPYTYSSEAAHQMIDELYPGASVVEVPNMKKVWKAGEKGAHILVPVENSSSSVVWDHLKQILKGGFSIVAETHYRVHMCMVGLPGSSLKQAHTVISHPQGLKQSSRYLAQYPQLQHRVSADHTGDALLQVKKANDPSMVALGSPLSAEQLGLQVFAHDVANNPDNNITRMFALRRDTGHMNDPDLGRTFYAANVTLFDRPGSLRNLLKTFADGGVNILSLHNTPTRTNIPQLGETYGFFVEMEPQGTPQDFSRMVKRLKRTPCVHSTAWYGGWNDRIICPESSPGDTRNYPLEGASPSFDTQKPYHGFYIVPERKSGVLSKIVTTLSGPSNVPFESNLTSVDTVTIGNLEYAFRFGMHCTNPLHVSTAQSSLSRRKDISYLACGSFNSPKDMMAFLKPEANN